MSSKNGRLIVSDSLRNVCITVPSVVERTTAFIANRFCEPELDERVCKYCHQRGMMFEDWKNGDRICTACGIVDEQHLMDNSPEWREYENDDKGNAANLARSGLVLTDESKYWGGLQPTTLSKSLYNGPIVSTRSASTPGGTDNIRKRIYKATYGVERRIDQIQKGELKVAKLSYDLRTKRRKIYSKDNDVDDENFIQEARPEFEDLVLQEDEDANRIQMALYSEKWSLQRALKLHDNTGNSQFDDSEDNDYCEAAELRSRLDKTLQKASHDLYVAHSILEAAAQKLRLPAPVTNDAAVMLCRFAQVRDGLTIRGIASNNPSNASSQQNDSSKNNVTRSRNSIVRACPNRAYNYNSQRKMQLMQQQQTRQQQQRLGLSNARIRSEDVDKSDNDEYGDVASQKREYVKWKQMGALCSALLFFSARNLKCPRSLVEVCNSIAPPSALANGKEMPSEKEESFIQRKHCSRAMSELKQCFPDYARSSFNGAFAVPIVSSATISTLADGSIAQENQGTPIDDTESINHTIEHSLRKLNLPPVAQASIQCLVFYWCTRRPYEVVDSTWPGVNVASNPNIHTVCAAMALFVCSTGSAMQDLAAQAVTKHQNNSLAGQSSIPLFSWAKGSQPITVKHKTHSSNNERGLSFDVFEEDPTKIHTEQRAYEMRRMWDAWMEQLPWARSISKIVQSCSVSQNVIRDYYKKQLYPNRQKLLSILCNSVCTNSHQTLNGKSTPCGKLQEAEQVVLGETPLASVLLPNVTLSAPMLPSNVKI